ncbi:TlpA disulfide reductase family protein [Pedobacter aquatilis]|uniref:TlpA disulfide reductase family protein n=1 Tax=Pedobacter aquatilis TaxID=351343 RepID=UPI00292F4353|nr:TlpA disulfide reductase family protein [Pedobacter aquatilis]
MKNNKIDVIKILLCILLKSGLVLTIINLIVFLLIISSNVSAQPSQPERLIVGSNIPEQLWNANLTVIHESGERTLSLHDFRGKPFILDFWTTWCGVCIKNLPRLDSIHYSNRGKLNVLMLNASSSKTGFSKEREFIRRFLGEHKSFFTPLILRNDDLQGAFAIASVPRYIWVGADGEIKAITGHTELTGTNIEKFISGGKLNLNSQSK